MLNSQWSLGWGEEGVTSSKSISTITKYHNESQISFKEKSQNVWNNESKKAAKMRSTSEFFNKMLPTFDPKTAGKSSVKLGDDKVDYRKKDQVFIHSNKL